MYSGFGSSATISMNGSTVGKRCTTSLTWCLSSEIWKTGCTFKLSSGRNRELRACLEVLAKKKRSVKRKPPTSPEGRPPAWGKILKVVASSSPSSDVGAGDSSRGSGGGVEPPLEVLPLSVWSPPWRGAAPPPAMSDEVKGDRDLFEPVGSEDSLLSHAELVIGAVSSILRDFDLRKVEALYVEEALALLLQGTSSVRPSAFVDLFLYCFSSVS